MLLLMAVLLGVAGVVLHIGFAANNSPGSGQISLGIVAIGAALVLAAVVLAWLAWGVWHASSWRTRLALVFSLAAIAYLA